ncbi:MAG: response regulator [Deltaproteobacteria bacterium]|nr:response regulator [Deltaproteobacteria bacterium]HDZ24579.1 response regulator [Desulfobacteraceae bacterium]
MNEMKAHILVVDDEEQIRRLLRRMLERQGYACTLAADAGHARKCLGEQNFELALCDVQMAGESGIDLARHIRGKYEDTVVIMVTGVDDPGIAETAMELGIYGYIIKPFNPDEVIINIRNALRRRELEISNRLYRRDLERMVAERIAGLRKAMEGIVEAITLAVESRDPYTAGHQQRVADLAHAMAREMGLSDNQREGIRMAGMIHDLGKISVPAEILSKPTRLTKIEFALIKNHSRVGYDILKKIEFPWPIAQMVLQHHEKMDGSGYPDGLSGEGILPEARILCVADVVEAMASHRPYRPALGIDKALKEIEENRGILYDPNVVDACVRLFRERGFELRP